MTLRTRTRRPRSISREERMTRTMSSLLRLKPRMFSLHLDQGVNDRYKKSGSTIGQKVQDSRSGSGLMIRGPGLKPLIPPTHSLRNDVCGIRGQESGSKIRGLQSQYQTSGSENQDKEFFSHLGMSSAASKSRSPFFSPAVSTLFHLI